MEFKLIFFRQNGKDIVEYIGEAGLDMVDLVREEKPEISHLPIDELYFNLSCPVNKDKVTIDIDEDFARKTNLFKGRTKVAVDVKNFLTKYIELDIEVRYDVVRKYKRKFFGLLPSSDYDVIKTGIRNASISYKFNYNQLLNDWYEAGCPLVWNL